MQIESLGVVKRKFTGVGFFTDFMEGEEIPDDSISNVGALLNEKICVGKG